MSCGCKLSQTSRSRAVSPIVALAMLAVLAVPILAAVFYQGAARESHARDEPISTSNLEVSAEGSDWTGLVTATLDGTSFAMADLSGKPTILYFWATWCPQCKIQREVLNTLSHEWGDRVRIAALTVDDEVSSVQQYLRTYSSLPQELRASSELLRIFNVEALPTLAVVDKGGRVQRISNGLTDASELRQLVNKLLP